VGLVQVDLLVVVAGWQYRSGRGGKLARVLKVVEISLTNCVVVSYMVKDSTAVLVNVVVDCAPSETIVVTVAVSSAAVILGMTNVRGCCRRFGDHGCD
jgi:hypothetical protein